jgi:hypothetical protein
MLVRRLFQQTQEGRLAWQETGREGTYQAIIDEFVISIIGSPTEEVGSPVAGPANYAIEIRNAKGTLLERITDEDISERLRDSDGFMKDLHHRVRRIALGVETAIDRIILELEKKREDAP